MERKILNGWKEISSHIQRGVRTAQRWEASLGMPIHRPALKDHSAVVAFSDELDAWLVRAAPRETLSRTHENIRKLAWHTKQLASQTRALQDRLTRSLETHRKRVALRKNSRHVHAPARTKGAMLPFRRRHTPGQELLFP